MPQSARRESVKLLQSLKKNFTFETHGDQVEEDAQQLAENEDKRKAHELILNDDVSCVEDLINLKDQQGDYSSIKTWKRLSVKILEETNLKPSEEISNIDLCAQ